MKGYWKYGISIGVCLAALTVQAFSIGMWERDWPRDDTQVRFSLEEVQRDYRKATDTLESRHPMPFVEDGAFEALVAGQYRQLHDGMSEIELFRVLAPVVEALECGHSNLQTSKAYENVMMSRDILFPLDVVVVGSELFVADVHPSAMVPRGSRIMSINGRSAEEILETMLSAVTSDGLNRTGKIAKINNQFAHYYHLAADQSSTFDIAYLDAVNGRIRRLTLPGKSGSELYGAGRKHSSIDLYLDHAGMRTDFEGRIEPDYAYLRVSSFILDHRAFASFASEFFRELADRGTERLILDLRGNWGGPPRSSALLFSYLMDKPAPYLSQDAPFYFYHLKRDIVPRTDAYRGDLVVLTDGAVFSTTGHLVSLLRHHDRGLLIGDITGGGAMCTDGSHGMTLPNTGLRLHYATRIFSTPAEPDSGGAGIQPDIRIVPTIDDMIAGRDAVLGYVTTSMEMP